MMFSFTLFIVHNASCVVFVFNSFSSFLLNMRFRVTLVEKKFHICMYSFYSKAYKVILRG